MQMIENFITLYQEGYCREAVKKLLYDPSISSEEIEGNDKFSRAIVDYAITLTGEDITLAVGPNLALQKIIDNDLELYIRYDLFLEALKFDEKLMCLASSCKYQCEDICNKMEEEEEGRYIVAYLNSLRYGISFSHDEIDNMLEGFPGKRKGLFHDLVNYSQKVIRYLKKENSLAQRLNLLAVPDRVLPIIMPYLPLTFEASEVIRDSIVTQFAELKDGVPLIFMEAWEIDWQQFLNPLKDKEAVFVFTDTNQLLRCLWFDDVIDTLFDPRHVICVLDKYPIEQLLCQNQLKGRSFVPVMINHDPIVVEYHSVLVQLLTSTFTSLPKFYWEETQPANDLYYVGKRVQHYLKARQLGLRHSLALERTEFWDSVHDVHGKVCPSKDIRNVVKGRDYWRDMLARIKPIAPRRSLGTNNKIRIAHIVGTLNDKDAHAPTKRLWNIIQGYDFDCFEVFVFVTEQNSIRLSEYPSWYYSMLSRSQGKQIISDLENIGVKVCIGNDDGSFLSDSKLIAENMAAQAIDIAVFHEVSPINLLVARLTDVPKRVFFEHGILPLCDDFDLIVLSHQEEADRWDYPNTKVVGNDKALAPSKKASVVRKDLNVPKGALVLSTVVSRLDTRLTSDMCWAIGKILRCCPNVYYCPAGSVETDKMAIFENMAVSHRVRLQGFVDDAAIFLQGVDIYLNEFPIGGSSSVLEAMAAGCPIVTMYYDDNYYAVAARSGAYFVGLDRAVTTKEQYVELACQLINDVNMRKEWSDYSLQRYKERYSDPLEYSRRYQDIIQQECQLFLCAGKS